MPDYSVDAPPQAFDEPLPDETVQDRARYAMLHEVDRPHEAKILDELERVMSPRGGHGAAMIQTVGGYRQVPMFYVVVILPQYVGTARYRADISRGQETARCRMT
jgi:hypothetical protein